ncbi:Flagellar protein FlgJ [Thermodesulfatator indicus DSM 15286]|uniref:Flagellar protein FlgJ n=1 Tax=Thermodesulfatator indicus (strain DSM 15286 / JCM 11887 / CIR29812) TaxID=667014 RepID=F8AAR2_THEID|nr:rod-binding protein [Thermodesulfatator indicus]AEH44343.1 Flagellar protein FlgJ [Thermodesulfatator indicus DSM 15286]
MKLTGFDLKSVYQLERLAQKHKDKALRKACQEFEAIFLYQILKGLKKTIPESGFWPKSFQRDMYEDLFYQEVSLKMAERGTGLSKMLYRELSRKYGKMAGSK